MGEGGVATDNPYNASGLSDLPVLTQRRHTGRETYAKYTYKH